MPRPLDIIPELVGATYSVATEPFFFNNGTLYCIRRGRCNKHSLIDLVSRFGTKFWVYSCAEDDGRGALNSWQKFQEGPMYHLFSTIVDDRVSSSIRLRITK